VPAETLHAAKVAAGQIKRPGNGRVPQAVRPDPNARALAHVPHDEIQTHPAQATAAAGPIQGREQRSGRHAANGQPGGQRSIRRLKGPKWIAALPPPAT
jgi:hypothetical protein